MSALWSLLMSVYITGLIAHLNEHYTVTVAIFSKLQYTCVPLGLSDKFGICNRPTCFQLAYKFWFSETCPYTTLPILVES
jgi:hypothetical protein